MTYTNRLAKKEWDERALTLEGAMSAILDRYEGDIETFYESGNKHVNDMLIALREMGVDYSRFKRVCEVGCGIGRLTVHFADLFESVWATDISQEMVDKARRKGNISYVCTGSLTVLPPFFDAVLSHILKVMNVAVLFPLFCLLKRLFKLDRFLMRLGFMIQLRIDIVCLMSLLN